MFKVLKKKRPWQHREIPVKKKGNSIQRTKFHKMVENNQKEWRRGMKERKWKNNNMEEK